MNHEAAEKGEKTVDAVQRVAGKVSEKADELKEQFDQYSESLTEYIKKCPIKSIAIASAVGCVLGLLIKR